MGAHCSCPSPVDALKRLKPSCVFATAHCLCWLRCPCWARAPAGGDYPRAIALLEPLLNQLAGERQAEVRLIYAQALVGDRQFGAALVASQTLLASTPTRADLNSAAGLLTGQALRGLERWDDAA